jgi:hypothetical protein
VSDGVAKSLLRFANSHRNRNREASLPGAAKGAVTDDLRGQVHVGIGQNNNVILRAALALHALTGRGGAHVHVLGDGCRADKTDRAHLRMVAQGVDDGAAAIDEIHDTFGQTGLLQEFERAAHGERNALGRLQDKSISTSDGIGKKPENDHRRKIEWGDGRDDSQRLANLHFIHAGGHVLKVVALHHHRNAASNFHIFNAAAQLGFRLSKSLSVLESNEARKFVEIFFQQVFQLEKILDTLAGRSAAPDRKGGGGSLNGSIHISGSRKGRARKQLGRSGIGDISIFGGG